MGSRDAAIKVEKKREGTYGGFAVGKFSEREFALHEKIEIRIGTIMRSFTNMQQCGASFFQRQHFLKDFTYYDKPDIILFLFLLYSQTTGKAITDI